MLDRLFHIAINSRDLDRSVAFYEKLGFTQLQDRTVTNEQLKVAFAVPCDECRFVHLRLGDSDQATLLDIVEWGPPGLAEGNPTPPQNAHGLTRFAVLTESTDRVAEVLKEDGATFITEPTTVMTPEGGWRVCLVTDPDGVVVQITELVAPAA
ncbi:MAG TPA: VOC family protein [Gaiellaceae bacterium]|jgi:catechol 2,3-dioxygenase-like lactoylglutathione lyase family enzyme